MNKRYFATSAALCLLVTVAGCDEVPDDLDNSAPSVTDEPDAAAEGGDDDEDWDESGSTGDAGCDAGCDDGDDADAGADDDDADPSGGDPDGEPAPQLQVLLTDAPLDAQSVFVTISEVRVQRCDNLVGEPSDGEEPGEDEDPETDSGEDGEDADGADGSTGAGDPGGAPGAPTQGGGPADADADEGGCEAGVWESVVEEEMTFDLLTLQDGVTDVLGVATLPAGQYGQIRLMLVDATVVVDAEEFPLTIPSGTQSGIKLNHGFELVDGMLTSITLDFDAGRSVKHTPGNGWMMRPVIDVIATVEEPLPEDPPAGGDAGDDAGSGDAPDDDAGADGRPDADQDQDGGEPQPE